MPLVKLAPAALAVAFLSAPFALPETSVREESPREKDLRRAERILAKLRELDEATAVKATAETNPDAYKSVADKFRARLFDDAHALAEGDLKTDLTTAVFLHDATLRSWRALQASPSSCSKEKREIFRRLCLETRARTRLEMLRARARLHARWAAALVAHARGARDGPTLDALAEMRAERRKDFALASSAIAALRSLESEVEVYSTLAEFDERRAVARVSFREFSDKAARAFDEIDSILASLPRTRARQLLQNARDSYRDGLFWWSKSHKRMEATVSASALEDADALEAERIDLSVALYTVVLNWRSASRYTSRAEEMTHARSGSLTAALR